MSEHTSEYLSHFQYPPCAKGRLRITPAEILEQEMERAFLLFFFRLFGWQGSVSLQLSPPQAIGG